MASPEETSVINAGTEHNMRRLRVIIAEDFKLVQEAMRLLLEPHLDVVAVADDGREAIQLAEKHRPDVLLVDVSLPLVSGFGVAEEVRKIDPKIKTIFVTAIGDKAYVERAFELGARGYVLKGSVRVELPFAIEQAMRGSVYCSPAIARSRPKDNSSGPRANPIPV